MLRKASQLAKIGVIFSLWLTGTTTVAQTGPGGVGNSDGNSGQPENILWLDAEKLGLTDGVDVINWTDQSGNENDLGTSNATGSGVPTLRLDGGIEYLDFNSGEADRLVKRDFSGFPSANATTFVIFRTSSSGEGIVSYAVSGESNEYLIYDAGGLDLYVENQRRSPSGATFNTGAWQLMATRWQTDGTATLHQAGTAITVNDFDNGRTIEDGGALAIGGEQDDIDDGYQTSQDFDGDIAEVIIYDAYLNNAQRIIVENYLSAKYGISISSDLYVGDDALNGDFDYDVAGIGYSGAEGHTEGSSAGFVLSSTSLGDGEYLLTGHDNTTNATVTTELQTGVDERFARTWYVDKTGNFDASLAFDLGDVYPGGQFPQDKNDYVLLRKNGATYDSVSVGGASKAIIEDQIVFQVADADLIDGEYTLGTTDAATSPVAGLANKTWYSYQSGDWSNPNVWTLDGSISPLLVNPDNEVPSVIDDVVITTGRTVTMDIDGVNVNSIKVTGRLDIATTKDHDFTTISGSGRIRMAGSSGSSNFPSGDASAFSDATSGGTLEVYGSSDINIDEEYTFNDVVIAMDATTEEVTLLRDLTINGNLALQSGTFKINDNSNTTSLNVTVYGEYVISTGAEQRVGTANARHEFNFYGDFTNNGTAYFSQRTAQDVDDEATDGIVDANFLADDTDQRVDVNAPTYFYRIVCDKGSDQTYILDLETNNEANFVLTGPADYDADTDVDSDGDNANALALINGTVKIGANIVINPLSSSGNYSIGTNARLWVAGGTVTKTTDSGAKAVTVYGTLEVSEGLLVITTPSGITMRQAGEFKCSGGTVATPQIRTSGTGTDHRGSYEQTGGTVDVGQFTVSDYFTGSGLPTTSDSPYDVHYTFSLPYGDNSFIMSGGTLNVQDATSDNSSDRGGLIFINSDPGNVNVTGGTVIAESNNTDSTKITSRAPFYDLVITNSSSSANAKVVVTRGTSGSTTDATTLTAQDLVVLNNLVIQTGTTRTSSGNTYGTYLDLCPNGVSCANLEVGRDLTVSDNAVLDVFTDNADNDGSSTVTFNSTTDGVLYIGDITSYNNALTGYSDPGGSSNTYGSYRFPLYRLIIDKPDATLQLEANGPVNSSSGDNEIGGEKNVRGTKSRLIYVRDQFALRSGATLNQIDPNDDGLGYSMRLYTDTLEIDGNLFVYEQGVNPTNAFVEFGGNNGTIVIQSTASSTIGNIVTELINDEIKLTSDLYVKRFAHRHGGVNLGTHNLKIDVLDLNPENGGSDNVRLRTINSGDNTEYVFGVNGGGANQFFYTAGNASDGGLTLRVPRETNIYGANSTDNVGADPNFNTYHHEYQNRNLLWFPIGVNGKYTPAVAYLHNHGTTDGDEYITVNPVDAELKTTNLEVAANDGLLDYYWNVSSEGYASGEEPTVSWLFQYDDTDAGNLGTEGEDEYVPGKVLDEGAYTRSSEGNTDAVKNGGDSGEQGSIIGGDPRNIIIFNGFVDVTNDNINGVNQKVFNTAPGSPAGVDTDPTNTNWQSAFPGTGFALENANYTAGVADRFDGAPETYYARLTNNFTSNVGAADDWDDAATWSTVSHTGPAASDYPQAGDIAIIRAFATSGERKVIIGIEDYSGNAGIDVEIAKLVLEKQNINETNNASNRLMIAADANVDFGVVEGDATFQVYLDNTDTPTFNDTDFGDFVSRADDGAQFLFFGNSDGTLTLPSEITEYPNVRFEGNNNVAIDRFFEFPGEAVVRDLTVDSRATFRVKHNLTITDDFRVGSYRQGFVQFDGTNGAVSITVEDEFRLRSNNGNRIFINDSNTGLEHRLTVNGNIDFDNNTATEFDLFTNLTGGDNVVLEFGTDAGGAKNWTNDDDIVPELYKIVMNGGTSTATTFTVNTEFTLPSATSSFQPIEIINGSLVLNNPDVDVTIANGSDFYLPNIANVEASSGSGGLEIQQGVLRVEGDDTGIILDGLLRINGGELDMDDATNNGNNFIEYSSSGNAELEVSAGTLTVGSHVRRSTLNSTGILKYRQTGGTVTVGSQAAPLNNRAMFEVLNSGSEFTHTGGSFTILRQNGTNPTVASLLLEPDTYNLSGSTINLGGASTPTGQTISVNSTIPLNNLIVDNSSINDPTVQITGRVLTVSGDLTINSDATFDADGWGLTLNGNFVTDGNFVANGNTTTFGSSASQQISGSTAPTFYNLTKSAAGTVTLSGVDITVDKDFHLLSGTLNDGGRTVTLLGDMVHNATHTTPSAGGEGILFAGSTEQELTRSGDGISTFGKLTISNSLGVTIPDGNGYNFNISESLRLEAGVFDIGSSLLTVAASATIEEVSAFGSNNMIQTNSSFTDNGVKKEFNAIGSATAITFPVGQTKYTPVVFNVTSSDAGSLTVRPANEVHPSIVDDAETAPNPEVVDMDNVLQYYWIIKAEDLASFSGDALLTYDQGDVAVTDGNAEGDYVPARIYQGNIDKSLPTTNINTSTNVITFPLNGGDTDITGDYLAGIPYAIPDEVPTYETTGTSSDYTASATWSPIGSAPAVTDGVGPVGAIIIVKNGHTLTLNQNDVRVYQTEIEENGILVVDETFGHRLGEVTGTGTLRVVSSTTSAVLPAGFYNDFFDCSGGSLEYDGTGSYDILGGITSLRNLTLSGSGDRILPSNNLTVCNDLTVDGPTLDNANDRAITVQHDVLVDGGTFDNGGGTLLIANDMHIDGGTFDGGSGDQVVDNDLNILSGTLNVGSDNTMSVKGDVTYSGGTFDGGAGNATLALTGTARQTVTGAFTGGNGFHRLRVDNGAGASFAGNADVGDELILDNGIVHTNSNTFTLAQNATVDPVGGSSSSYVNGRVHKVIASGSSFTFPTGDGNRYGKVSVQSTSGGPYTWYAQYYSGNVVNEGAAGSFDPSTGSGLETISKNEYWRIGDDAPVAGTLLADIELRWDASSDVSAVAGERSELCVAVWNTTTTSWDNHGGEGHGVGVTFNSTIPVDFSERVVTLGSTTANNALPVELISFEATAQAQSVLLNWETASEIDNDYFEVQRSADGIEFEKIGEVAGHGTTSQLQQYKFEDKLPLAGISYYRLKQVDYNGMYDHSDAVSVEWINDGGLTTFVDLELYPNPLTQGQAKLRVKGLQPRSTVTVKLIDMFGKAYLQQIVTSDQLGGQNGYLLQPRIRLATGVYVVSIQQGSQVYQKTLIVR